MFEVQLCVMNQPCLVLQVSQVYVRSVFPIETTRNSSQTWVLRCVDVEGSAHYDFLTPP